MAKANEAKKELAYLLFMSGVSQKEIRERVGIGSPVTIQRWIEAGGWREKRAAKTVTRQELINGILQKIADYLDGDNDKFNPDQLVKLASAIDRLDKNNSPIVAMDVLMDFSSWLQQQAALDPSISIDTIKLFNKYHDKYVTSKITGV